MVNLETIKKNGQINSFFRKTHAHLGSQGISDHDYSHSEAVSMSSRTILEKMGYPSREVELAGIAGYLHDIGNVITRYDHGRTGGVLVFTILEEMGMEPEDIATVASAIGNHEERNGSAISNVSAAVIIADKSDLSRDRVKKTDFTTFTVKDRVNYAVEKAELQIEPDDRIIKLKIQIDLEISSVMEYFEIFLKRMLLCRRSALLLNCTFELFINENRFL